MSERLRVEYPQILVGHGRVAALRRSNNVAAVSSGSPLPGGITGREQLPTAAAAISIIVRMAELPFPTFF
jgi:hypothetical protein